MLQVWGRAQRFNRSVGKVFREDSPKPGAELFSSDTSSRTRRVRSYKFKPARFRASKSADFEQDTVLAAFFHSQDAARKISLVRPQMDHRGLAFASQITM